MLLTFHQYFHTADLKEAGGLTIAWSLVTMLSAMFENVTMSMLHTVCLIWKFSRGGRGATFLPSNMAQELQINVFDCRLKTHILLRSGF